MRKYDGGWPNMLEARACWWVDGMRLGSTVSDGGLTACCTRASAEARDKEGGKKRGGGGQIIGWHHNSTRRGCWWLADTANAL